MRPRFEIAVTPAGKGFKRELLVDGYKTGEFKNRAELIDFIMQAVSALRYDADVSAQSAQSAHEA